MHGSNLDNKDLYTYSEPPEPLDEKHQSSQRSGEMPDAKVRLQKCTK